MAELVAQTTDAVAVDENLTTLIDWTNIEQVSGFTVIVNNAGGGSGNDISDVQIDTSDDGGITPALDQHAGVPAVPIASDAAAQGTFTESAKFVRIRALCAAGEDTTAEATLLASTSDGRICTLSDVKTRLSLDSTGYDLILTRIIAGLKTLFETYTRRTLVVPATAATEYYTGRGPILQVAAYPVVSITSIKIAYDYDFDNVDALVADTDYRLLSAGRAGLIEYLYANWPSNRDSIQVVYRGGYAAAGQVPGTGETAMPADLREAAIEQASFLFKRRDDIGLASVGFDGGDLRKFSAMKLLPMVKDTLDNYRRLVL